MRTTPTQKSARLLKAKGATAKKRGRNCERAGGSGRRDRLPPLWRRIELTGVELLIGELQVIAVTEDSISARRCRNRGLGFARIGREHLA